MTCYRITKRRHRERAFDGEGARRAGGRWNRRDTAIVYCSASLALATLEILVHASQDTLVIPHVRFEVVIPEDVAVETVSDADLPEDWARYPHPPETEALGSAWAARRSSVVLSVPSAVVPQERTFLLNPGHPAFPRLRIAGPWDLRIDPRLG